MSTGSDEHRSLRLSTTDRRLAFEALGVHYADGRIDEAEFDTRIDGVSTARTLGDLEASFTDLPGGVPLAVSTDGTIVAVRTPDEPLGSGNSDLDVRELRSLQRRGRVYEKVDVLAVPVVLVTFLVLQFVVGWSWAWIVWPGLGLIFILTRTVLRYSDEDEATYPKIKDADRKARQKRIEQAAQRIREVE